MNQEAGRAQNITPKCAGPYYSIIVQFLDRRYHQNRMYQKIYRGDQLHSLTSLLTKHSSSIEQVYTMFMHCIPTEKIV